MNSVKPEDEKYFEEKTGLTLNEVMDKMVSAVFRKYSICAVKLGDKLKVPDDMSIEEYCFKIGGKRLVDLIYKWLEVPPHPPYFKKRKARK